MHEHHTAVSAEPRSNREPRSHYLDAISGPAFGKPTTRFPSDVKYAEGLAADAEYMARHQPTLNDDEADLLDAIRTAAAKRKQLQQGVAGLLRKLNRSDLAGIVAATVSVAVVSHVDGQRAAAMTFRLDAGRFHGEWTTDHRTDERNAIVMAVDSFLLDAGLPDVPALGFRL